MYKTDDKVRSVLAENIVDWALFDAYKSSFLNSRTYGKLTVLTQG